MTSLLLLLPDWTSLPWADYGIAGAVIVYLGTLVFAQRRDMRNKDKDILGLAERANKVSEDSASRMERLTGEYADSIKENTKVTAALHEFLRHLNGNKPL